MVQIWILVTIVLVILLLERVTVSKLTRSAKGREWVIRHGILHPNAISLVRIPMGLVSIGMWVAGWQSVAVVWFSFWMITDLTDGTIARNCDLATEKGKWLDPLSDKCMYFPSLAFFAYQGILPVVWVGVLIVTDTVGQASRLLIKKKAANYFGKAKTALVTILLATVALDQIEHIWFMSPQLVSRLSATCAILAILSVYCKVIPDLWYANSLSVANFLCGLAAIWQVLHDRPVSAFILIFVGQFFDLLDGRLARMFGSTLHGAILDDLADGTSFGLATGVLIHYQLGGGAPGYVVAGLYAAAIWFRLYRFAKRSDDVPPDVFLGLPSPAGAMLAGASALVFVKLPMLAGAIVTLTALLCVSTIPYRHFARKIWPVLPKTMKLLVCILFLVFVNMTIADKNYAGAFALFCFTMAALYVIYGLDVDTLRRSRRVDGAAPPDEEPR